VSDRLNAATWWR